MKPQHLLASACIAVAPLVNAFSPPSVVPSRRKGRCCSQLTITLSSNPTATALHQTFNAEALSELEDRIAELVTLNNEASSKLISPGRSVLSSSTLDEATSAHGMPWTTTIGRSDETNPLLYMPFWSWQLSFMQSNLSNLHPLSCNTTSDVNVSFNENTQKRARIVNHCYASDEYRKIRMTYYDAGDSVQVFNSVWYPDAKYNLPVLGIDLLSFNRKRYLAIVDFQPLHESEEDHANTYEHIMHPIKEKHDNLKGRMSSKFYDETQFFSKEMLFARFEDGKIVDQDLFPAFKAYVQTHVDLVQRTPAAMTASEIDATFNRQQAYDTYSASRDPAAGLFASMFGKEWAEDFIYDFLFSLSERSDDGLDLSPPSFGGPPKGGQDSRPGGGNPYAVVKKPDASKSVQRV